MEPEFTNAGMAALNVRRFEANMHWPRCHLDGNDPQDNQLSNCMQWMDDKRTFFIANTHPRRMMQ